MARPTPLLEVNALKKHFPIRGGLLGGVTGQVYAVDGVSFHIAKGETLSLVGESGCGKSTVGKAILRLVEPTDGEVFLDGQPIHNPAPWASSAPSASRVQVVFQDPFSSLNPRMRVRDIIAEPLRNFGMAGSASETDDRVAKLMDTVRLPRDAMRRFPTSSAAASASASASPAPSPPAPTSSSATKPSAPSTSPSRPRSST